MIHQIGDGHSSISIVIMRSLFGANEWSMYAPKSEYESTILSTGRKVTTILKMTTTIFLAFIISEDL